jgi:hypothetical protein
VIGPLIAKCPNVPKEGRGIKLRKIYEIGI